MSAVDTGRVHARADEVVNQRIVVGGFCRQCYHDMCIRFALAAAEKGGGIMAQQFFTVKKHFLRRIVD